MAFGIAGLVNNIKDSATAFVNKLTGESEKVIKYPKGGTFNNIESQINPANWKSLPKPYTFAVMDKDSNNAEFKEFALPLSPQELTQDENFAINIKTTQGGTVVNHSGNKYKDLVISGTTGVAPFRGAGGVESSTGKAIFQPDELKYFSGYEVFLGLRNWFKSYYQYKKDKLNDEKARRSRLIFKNYKDGEFLIVEVIKFTMKRDSSKPFMYNYQITFKVLGHQNFKIKEEDGLLSSIDNILETGLDKINLARGIFLRSQDILRQIEATYDASLLEPLRKATLAVKALKGIPTTAADMGNRIIKNTVSAASAFAITTGIKEEQEVSTRSGVGAGSAVSSAQLPNDLENATATRGAEVVTDLDDALLEVDPSVFPEQARNALDQDLIDSVELPRSFYEDAISEFVRVRDNAADFFNLSSDVYDSQEERTPTLKAESTKEITDEEYDLLYAFNQSITAFRNILSSPELFKGDFNSKLDDIQSKFDDNLNLVDTAAVREMILPANTDLERLALQELLDSSRWVEIAELNSLKAPYIEQDKTLKKEGILVPGDKILIPDTLTSGFSSVPPSKEITRFEGRNEVEKNMGIDLIVTDNGDLEFDNAGDLIPVAGSNNIAQSIILKLFYERGDLIKHPDIGANMRIGQKFPDLNEVRDNVINSLTQDPRIERVSQIEFERINSELKVSFKVHVKNIDIPVPITVKL